jgi:hypothetical protein
MVGARHAVTGQERTNYMPSPYEEFRVRLDEVLRGRDPAALRAFLVTEGQWDADTATDPERALWLMIATSRALGDLHAEAFGWLTAHGYSAEVAALRGGAGAEPRPSGGQGHGARRGAPPRERRRGTPPKRRE